MSEIVNPAFDDSLMRSTIEGIANTAARLRVIADPPAVQCSVDLNGVRQL